MTEPYLMFDRSKLTSLQASYEASVAHTLQLLPPINWNSPAQIKAYFWETFDIPLESVKIKYLESKRKQYEEIQPETFDTFTGAIHYLRLKATLNNYILCILRHMDEHDKFYLRDVDGIWLMPNKQPIMNQHSTEIWACVKSYSADLLPLIEAL